MNYLSKEQIKRLQDIGAEPYLYTCYVSDYKRNSPTKVNTVVADVLDEITGKKNNRHFGCGACCFNLFKSVAKVYYPSVEYYESEPTKENRDIQGMPVTDNDTTKTKKGRKKKGE